MTRCEDVRLDAMARMDGEAPLLPEGEARAHLDSCAACREAVDGLRAVAASFAGKTRPAAAADLWPALESRVVTRTPSAAVWIAAGALLGVYKLAELVPAWDLGLAAKLAAAALAAAALLRLRAFTVEGAY